MMRRLGFSGFAVIAILALAAIAMAGTATALEILPTPTAEKPVKFTDKGGSGSFTTLKKSTVLKCLKITSKGEFTSTTLGKDTIVFEGCEAAGAKCTGLKDGTAGNITVNGEVHFTDGLLSSKQVSTWAVLLTEGVHLTCGAIVLSEILSKSCWAGLVLESSLDKLVSTAFVSFLLKEKIEGDTDIPFINLPTESACELKLRTNESAEEDMLAITQEEEEIEGFEQSKVKVTVLLHTK